MARVLILCGLSFFYSFAASAKKTKKVNQKDLAKLYAMMQGEYNSIAQSKSDTDYYAIMLKMKPMWQHKKGEYWLYVEQAMQGKEDKPYRQRVYQLSLLNDTTITSTVYTIKDGEKYYGDYKKEKPLEGLTPDSLEARKGCLIYMHKTKKGNYAGGTHANDCESSLRGASYATTDVKISKKKVVSWDRGFDAKHEHVWGATKGGYIFVKE